MTREEVIRGARQAIHDGSKSFRAASLLFDRSTRERAWLLYCWCRYCDDMCDGQTLGSSGGCRGSVSELRRKTGSAAGGEVSDELPFEALRHLIAECPVPEQLLEDHLTGFELDEQGWKPASEADLERYCYHVAGSVGCMMAILMGVSRSDEETLDRAADLGIAFQLSNIARDIREDLANGRCYLPQEWLLEFGVQQSELFVDRNRDALVEMVQRLVKRVEFYETRSRRGVHRLPFRSRLAILSAARIYGAIGRRVGSMGASAWDRRVTVGKVEKLGFLLPSFAEAMTIRHRPR